MRVSTHPRTRTLQMNESDIERLWIKDEKQRMRMEELNAREKRSLAYIQKLKADCDQMRWERDFFNRENNMTTAFIRFARRCQERAADLAADAYVAHGVEALLAADALARAVGGRIYCDVVEMPSFGQRSVTYDVDSINLSLLDHAFDGILRGAAGISTIGWALKEKIENYGPPVTVIPNYRQAQDLYFSVRLREECGIGADDHLLLASSTITSGFEPIVESLILLPSNVHLATLGTIWRGYRPQVDALVERLGVERRVHFFDPVPYEQLTTVSSGANIGLMAIDPSLTNDQISLPNRLFDCIAAGLPIVTPDVPDIARIVRERNLGVTVPQNEATAWAEAIKTALAGEQTMRANALAAAKELVWESLADDLLAAYDHPSSVTIVSFSDLTTHQRTIRMTDTLLKRGVKVTICCPQPEEAAPTPEIPGVRFVFTPRMVKVPPKPAPPTANTDRDSASQPAAQAEAQPPDQTVATTATLDGANRPMATKANGPAGPTAPSVAAKPGAVGKSAELILKLSEPPRTFTAADELALERLKKEVMELRYKAGRYDEVKNDLATWRAKAARYDLLKAKPAAALLGIFRRGSK